MQVNKDDVIDITDFRTLLKPASQRLRHTPTTRSVSDGVVSPTGSQVDYLNHGSSFDGDLEFLTERIEDDPEAKTVLFETGKSKILQFEHGNNGMGNESQGRLLGSGKFEIYQLHQQKVSYLQCGNSIVYPILPRLKILKISHNQFLVTLSNPERYWRIIIDTDNESEILKLEDTLKRICSFRNLYIKPIPLKIPTPAKLPKAEETIPNFDLRTSFSSTSITSEMACFQLGSDTSTFVEKSGKSSRHVSEQPSQETIGIRPTGDNGNDNDNDNNNNNNNDRSDVESLDLAFDEFTKTIEEEDTTALTTTASVDLMRSKGYSTGTGSSMRSSSLHLLGIEETNWMDLGVDDGDVDGDGDVHDDVHDDVVNSRQLIGASIEADGYATTSTPTTQRYISLNLNPIVIPKRRDLLKKTQQAQKKSSSNSSRYEDVHKSRNFSDTSFYEIQKLQNKLKNEEDKKVDIHEFIDMRPIRNNTRQTKAAQKNRLSSFDVYNILRDATTDEGGSENGENKNNNDDSDNAGFRGFIKSFF
jgi:hypothetical protein